MEEFVFMARLVFRYERRDITLTPEEIEDIKEWMKHDET